MIRRAETAILALGGVVAGAGIGWALSEVLVAVLTGVFDPPRDALTVPWPYLAAVTVTVIASLAVIAAVATQLGRRSPISILREL